ncbi:hypothetical protein [Streptomyces katsurahamanus]|uniref:Uncharacterized protein n=1 Tax=Streptomyces katsurahamanus TaxID=2577098 RepID=A0ABW9NUR6_9ACTN|nr:hypothetical protein [Streptomyces katsurahamanus]MQS37053.1 hypothetical protein [Streptomyces katsurahamanus]
MTLNFPEFADSSKQDKIADLLRLADTDLLNNDYVDVRRASQLLGVLINSYQELIKRGQHLNDPFLEKAFRQDTLFQLTLSAAFDLVSNAEYLHGRVVNSKWIYCNRTQESPKAYYSFLKQCPHCCIEVGLGPRLNGAQHKPTSHHIGEITTVVSVLLLQMIAAANDEPFTVATITKQSHDVDAIGYRDDLLLLFEIKASPMVTFPLVVDLPEALLTDASGEPQEYGQHSLVDMNLASVPLSLAVPHRGWSVPLGEKSAADWPYVPMIEYFRQPDNFREYLAAWIELYEAYSTPKVQRQGRAIRLAYLVNGWGDEIDSNKTKPGLGRTDDIKKGTYQLVKFGSYYRDDSSALKVRGALVANLDPVSLRSGYIDGLIDIRWGQGADFTSDGDHYRIHKDRLKYLYDAIFAFNRPTLNDPTLQTALDLKAVASCLQAGRLDEFLRRWTTEGPDTVVDEVTSGELLW